MLNPIVNNFGISPAVDQRELERRREKQLELTTLHYDNMMDYNELSGKLGIKWN